MDDEDYRYPDWYMRVWWWEGWSLVGRLLLLGACFALGVWVGR